ncbi:hypothetical protein VOI32_00970 [Paraburkholderia caribensis]|uniref:Uncharacterized protein n=1 Tax=Paraburkholderia caribensis TaxID=75105 RepID=A0ABV0DPS2_9BURK|nr:hypothetical protein [Paraburkholderia caribensis]MCO4875600.1 hypothetical protein [Paraburkholderia caribensis]PTB30483.1 hypothetical protein C9I56_01650 [Paraburkholderia caribensis]
MNRAKREKAQVTNDSLAETSEELRARLRAFAILTREQAMRQSTVAFPEDVSVLAGPLQKVRRRG